MKKSFLNVKNVLQKRGLTREIEISKFTLVKIKIRFEKLSWWLTIWWAIIIGRWRNWYTHRLQTPASLWLEGSSPSLPTTYYGFLRCYREGKAEARMKLCQTEMVEVDLLRKQWNGLEHRPEKSCRRDRFEADWLSEKMDASPRKSRCIYSSKGRNFAAKALMVKHRPFKAGTRVRVPLAARNLYLCGRTLVIAHFVKIFWMQKICHWNQMT